ncbi:MAG: glycosyltransferase [Cyanobium sp.]
MRLILATLGTLGDHLPMAGLAHTLVQQGFEVRFACNPAMHPLARRAGVEPLAFGAALGRLEASATPLAWDHWQASPRCRDWTEADRRRLLGDIETLLALLQPGDVLVGTRNLYLLSLVARARSCFWLEVGLHCGAMIDYQHLPAARDSTHPWKRGLDRLERDLRQRLLGDPEDRQDPPPLLRLHAVPDAFAPAAYPQVPAVRTGFWCWDDPRWRNWNPPEALEQLLAADGPPLGLVFSSQPLHDPRAVLARHLEVAERLRRSLVLVRGWAFGDEEQLAPLLDHPALTAVAPLPLSWLLPRLSAVFIHGGMGTLAQALRAGCQVVIEPFGNDQFLNARMALQQDLALAVHPHRFDSAEVAGALESCLTGPGSALDPSAFAGLPQAATRLGDLLEQIG